MNLSFQAKAGKMQSIEEDKRLVSENQFDRSTAEDLVPLLSWNAPPKLGKRRIQTNKGSLADSGWKCLG